jgi:hypothetical protein
MAGRIERVRTAASPSSAASRVSPSATGKLVA